jgi:DNA-binding NarL/FixJ family response regulator
MPDIDGIEVGRQLHAIDPKVPLIAFTVLEPWGLESAARNAGILRVISKSEGWRLVETIEEVFLSREPQAGLSQRRWQ